MDHLLFQIHSEVLFVQKLSALVADIVYELSGSTIICLFESPLTLRNNQREYFNFVFSKLCYPVGGVPILRDGAQ